MIFFLKIKKLILSHKLKEFSILFSVFFTVSIFFGIYMYSQEKLSLIDTIYYLIVTSSTIGYGDISPKTDFGKMFLVLYVILSIATFAAILTMIVEGISKKFEKIKKGDIKVKNFVKLMIIGYPNEDKVKEIIEQLRNDERFQNESIVCVSHCLTEKPLWFDEFKVKFVKGLGSDVSVLMSAGIKNTETVLVLASDPGKIESDDFTVSALAIAERLNPEVKSIAERVRKDSLLFTAVGCNIVTQVTNAEVLAKEILDSGAIEFQNAVFSNETPGTQYNIENIEEIKWATLAYDFICKGVIPEGFKNPNEETFNLLPRPDDIVKVGALVKYRASERI